MSFKSKIASFIVMPLLASPVLAGGTFDLSSPQNAAICAAKLNDKLTAGNIDDALAMGCYADGAILQIFAPSSTQPMSSSEGTPDVYAFILGTFEQLGYVATQHLVGSIYMYGEVVHSSVHATHLKSDGTVEIGMPNMSTLSLRSTASSRSQAETSTS